VRARSLASGLILFAGIGGPGALADSELSGSNQPTALQAVAVMKVKGRAPMTGYDRDHFGSGWVDVNRNGCDTRDDILRRDLTERRFRLGTHGCVITAGMLRDPYTGELIRYRRGGGSEVDIDHVVALGDAWQKGAQRWPYGKRVAFANDPLSLGVGEPAEGRRDTATWLPSNRSLRCSYVARQVAVTLKFGLWVTGAERTAMRRVLSGCPTMPLPPRGSSPVYFTAGGSPPSSSQPSSAAGQARPACSGTATRRGRLALRRSVGALRCTRRTLVLTVTLTASLASEPRRWAFKLS
jgi:hypothetical protein